MKEDKQLQSLLASYGMQETSKDFDTKLMQKITAVELHDVYSKPLLGRTIQLIFIAIFIVVSIILLVSTLIINRNIFIVDFPIAFSQKTYTQLFYFLAAFWIVMSLNLWWNKKQIHIQHY